MRVWRCHDDENRRSDVYRLGTWYAPDRAGAERYRNHDPEVRLGGRTLSSGTIMAENPLVVGLATSRVLYDAWDALPFGGIMLDIAFAKETEEIRSLTERIVDDPELRFRLSRLPDFTIKTMLAERIAARWCIEAGYDLLIVASGGRASEMFDFGGLFRPDEAADAHMDHPHRRKTA